MLACVVVQPKKANKAETIETKSGRKMYKKITGVYEDNELEKVRERARAARSEF